MKTLKKLWNWLGKDTTHNAFMVIFVLLGLVIALPIFSNQINTIKIEVDALRSDIENIYNQYEQEEFEISEIEVKPDGSGSKLALELSQQPISNSVNIWWGALHLNPIDYDVQEKIVTISFSQSAEQMRDDDIGFVITYISVSDIN